MRFLPWIFLYLGQWKSHGQQMGLRRIFLDLGYTHDEPYNLLPHICTIYIELQIIMTSNLPMPFIYCALIFQVNKSCKLEIYSTKGTHEVILRRFYESKYERPFLIRKAIRDLWCSNFKCHQVHTDIVRQEYVVDIVKLLKPDLYKKLATDCFLLLIFVIWFVFLEIRNTFSS